MNSTESRDITMLRWLVTALSALFALSAQAETYLYTGVPYNNITNATTCAAPHTCGTFTAGQRVTGYITTAAPLAANLPYSDIAPNVTGYWFSNGVSTIASTDPASRVVGMFASTDAAGTITSATVNLHRWTYSAAAAPAAGPHAADDRLDQILLTNTSTPASLGAINGVCVDGVTAPNDVCITYGFDAYTSVASTGAAGTWSAPPTVSINSVSMPEGNTGVTVMNFTVTLSAVPTTPVRVTVAHTPVTASSGTDYVLALLTLNWAPGDPVTKTLPVVIQGDTDVEPDETFQITLSNPTGATLGTPVGTGTIVNDDGAAVAAVPALSEWAMALLALACATLGLRRVRRV